MPFLFSTFEGSELRALLTLVAQLPTDELSFFFNHSDISKTLFKGFETEMDQVFQKEYLEAEVDSAFE